LEDSHTEISHLTGNRQGQKKYFCPVLEAVFKTSKSWSLRAFLSSQDFFFWENMFYKFHRRGQNTILPNSALDRKRLSGDVTYSIELQEKTASYLVLFGRH